MSAIFIAVVVSLSVTVAALLFIEQPIRRKVADRARKWKEFKGAPTDYIRDAVVQDVTSLDGEWDLVTADVVVSAGYVSGDHDVLVGLSARLYMKRKGAGEWRSYPDGAGVEWHWCGSYRLDEALAAYEARRAVEAQFEDRPNLEVN